MTDGELRASTIEFIDELCERVGPFVFAGFGGRIASLQHEAMVAHRGDVMAGVLAAEAVLDENRGAWAQVAPVPAIFAVLLGLAVAPPAAYGEAERYEVLLLLALCVRRDPDGFAAERGRWADCAALVEVDEWLADEEPLAR